jgi:hypothetical protein
LHIGSDLVLVAALGIDADGCKHPLALVEGNAAVVQALSRRGNARLESVDPLSKVVAVAAARRFN